MKTMTEIYDDAKRYVIQQSVDYGDLSEQAERQIFDAYKAGAKSIIPYESDEVNIEK